MLDFRMDVHNENYAEDIALQIFDIGVIKFGEFTLKSGIKSPVYFDLREIVSFPKLMCISSDKDIPMLLKRKETKKYGTKKILEGRYNKNKDNCLIIEDVVTTGSSVLETAEVLIEEGLIVTDAVVFLDRDQGGSNNISDKGITLHSVFKVKSLIAILLKYKKISPTVAAEVMEFFQQNKVSSVPNSNLVKKFPFSLRAQKSTNKVAKSLCEIIELKKTNLCVAADATTCSKLLEIADAVGPHICLLKTHVDILDDFTIEFTVELKKLSKKHNFMIFEDRKFADIGKTVQLQYIHGVYKIQTWSDIVNAHAFPGPGIISALKQASEDRNACLLIAKMSSEGNLGTSEYISATKKMAEENKDFVIGFITQGVICEDDPTFIHMTPGVQFSGSSDKLGQQYITPEDAVKKLGADVIIVGRGITEADNPEQAAKKYKEAAYNSYLSLL